MSLMVKLLLWTLFAVALPTFMLLPLGHVSLEWQGMVLETTLSFFLGSLFLLIIGLYGLYRLLITLWHLPTQWRNQYRQQLNLKAEQGLSRALWAKYQGKNDRAEKILLQSAQKLPNGFMHYLTAAHIALENHHADKALKYLELAEEKFPKMAALLAYEKGHIYLNHFSDKVEDFLAKALTLYPQDANLWALEAQWDLKNHKYDQALEALDKARKASIWDENTWTQLKTQAYQGFLSQARDWDNLYARYRQMPKYWQSLPDTLATFINHALHLGHSRGLIAYLLKALPKHWDGRLLIQWGLIEDNLNERIFRAEKWAKAHPQDPNLLLTLARLYLKAELWGKALKVLQQRFKQVQDKEGYQLMIQALLRLNKTQEAARLCFQAVDAIPSLDKNSTQKLTNS